jgi:hypothetical protein
MLYGANLSAAFRVEASAYAAWLTEDADELPRAGRHEGRTPQEAGRRTRQDAARGKRPTNYPRAGRRTPKERANKYKFRVKRDEHFFQ